MSAATPGRPSLAQYRLGGRMVPMKSVPQCQTCQSPYRIEIERGLSHGYSYATIRRSILAEDESFSVSTQSMRNHFESGHMPTEVEAVRRNLERRSIQRGADIEHGVDTLVDGMALAEAVVAKTYTALAEGHLAPDLKDGLAAAQMLERFAPVEAAVSTEAYAQAFAVYFDIAARVMNPNQFEQFGRMLQADPTLNALIEKHAAKDPYAVTSTVVQDPHALDG